MKQSDIEQLSRIDAATLRRFADLPPDVQQQVIDTTRAPSLDPSVPAAFREISERQAKQFEQAMNSGRKLS